MTQCSPSSLSVKPDFSNATVYLWSNSMLLNTHMKPLLQLCLGLRKGPKQKQEQNEHKHHPSPFSILLHAHQNRISNKSLDLWASSCIKNLPLWIKLGSLLEKASVLIKTDIIQNSTKIRNLTYMLSILRIVDEQQTRFSDLSSLIITYFHYQKIIPKISRKSILLKLNSSE